ncbi:MAG: IS21-like element helper ATPase IstB [Candidatus Riflebacteria bacterium]|jgi:DNA replication protein DnaC|nr:IS21-like element helper ATPase IstB [Candidatus Riflebacteria bacterium]NCB47360.1 AAA family ATPase [bacterium]
MYEQQIAECCKLLKLGSSIAQSSQKIKADNHPEFLYKILQVEVERRKEAKRTRCLNSAGFYSVKTFDNYRFDEVKMPSILEPKDLEIGEFINRKENLVLYGNVGTGKTHMATAIGVEACKKGKEVKFFRTAALVNHLTEQKTKGNLSKTLKQMSKLDLLILDEWGYVPLEQDGARLLFQVISECYEKRSLILTTNLEFSKWVTIFYDEQMTAAIIDRIVHHGHMIVFGGTSKRLKGALMKN